MTGGDYKVGKMILQKFNAGNLGAGVSWVIPYGWRVLAVYSTDVDLPDLRMEFTTAAWHEVETEEGNAWTPDANVWTPLPVMCRSDGVNVRLRNTGANVITTLLIAYEE